MPYNPDNPPDVVRDLPKNKQRQWVEVWNSCHERGQSEKQCFQTAWGVVKKSSCDGEIIMPGESDGSVADATRNNDLLQGIIAGEVDSVRRKASNVFPFYCTMEGKIKPNFVAAENEAAAEKLMRDYYDNFPNAKITVVRVTRARILW